MASSSLRSDTESEDELHAALFPDARDAPGPNDSVDGVVEDELLNCWTNLERQEVQHCLSCR